MTAVTWAIRLVLFVWWLPAILLSWGRVGWLLCRHAYLSARVARLRRRRAGP